MAVTDDPAKARIEAETGLRPPFALQACPGVEAGVRRSFGPIRANPFQPHKDQLRSLVYDVRSGRVQEVAAAVPA